jgi:hypothetical protein
VTGYVARTRHVFPGDDWGELRDCQADYASVTMSRLIGQVAMFVQRSAVTVGAENELFAREMRAERKFDLRTMYVAHGHLAAFWRRENGHVHPTIPGLYDVERLANEFTTWATEQVAHWFLDNPRLVFLFAKVAIGWQSMRTVENEIELWNELKEYLPLPSPDNPDLFDDPKSYSPYP